MINKFNHLKDIKNTQPANFKSIFPGMIITFTYHGKKILDKNPLILFLYYDPKNKLVDGLNLNYLSDYRFKGLFEKFKNTTKVVTRDEKTSKLLGEDFTFISIPPTSKLSRIKSRSERRVEMQRMYQKLISYSSGHGGSYGYKDIYRSYSVKNIKSLKAVNLKNY
jgi:hypothetical protein